MPKNLVKGHKISGGATGIQEFGLPAHYSTMSGSLSCGESICSDTKDKKLVTD